MNDLRKLLYFEKPYWRAVFGAFIFLTFQVLLDLAIPRLVQQIIDQGIEQGDMQVVIHTSLWMLGLSLLNVVVAVGNNLCSVRVGESVARDIRDALFVRIQSFSQANMDHFSTGKLMVRLTSDTAAIQRLFQISLRIGTRAPLMMIGSMLLMLNTNRSLVLNLLPIFLVILASVIFFSLKMEPFFEHVKTKLDGLNTILQENIAGVRLVKAFARGDFERERFEHFNSEFTFENIRVMRFMAGMSPILTILVDAGIVMVVWSGGLQVIQGTLSLGQIVAFTNYLMMTMTPLLMMSMLMNIWANAMASARRINQVLEMPEDMRLSAEARDLPQNTRGSVHFEKVSFHYHDGRAGDTLKDIDFQADAGKTIAILGATGAGKSTLVNLIARYYDVTAGRVSIDGLDVRSIRPDSLLTHLAVVPQETVLFSGTIAENIAYGKPDASRQEVEQAARAAQAHEFITQFPQGYRHHVEARGTNLSGGQKQRIAIARAILMQPRLLILDDSTSAVDVETEARIQAALDEKMRDTTRFIVAQRISSVLKADRILVIDKGRIVAQGSHSDLMQSSPIYREIFDSQLGNDWSENSLLSGARAG